MGVFTGMIHIRIAASLAHLQTIVECTAMLDLNELSLPKLFNVLTEDGSLDRVLHAARAEDLAQAGDVTTASIISHSWEVKAAGVSRQDGIVAGLAVISRTLELFECHTHLELIASDGEPCSAGQVLWRMAGQITPILAAERTLLNLVGRLSGIATITRQYVNEITGSSAVICETRKTTPGMRHLEKYAVRCGGGTLHRLGLYDAVLLKDNHLRHLSPAEFAPAITRAAKYARKNHKLRFVEVEVDTLDQLELVLGCESGLIDIALLDNMSLEQLNEAVSMRDRKAPFILLEASGGIDISTVRAIALTGVDRISIGAITHSAPCLDIGLDLE